MNLDNFLKMMHYFVIKFYVLNPGSPVTKNSTYTLGFDDLESEVLKDFLVFVSKIIMDLRNKDGNKESESGRRKGAGE